MTNATRHTLRGFADTLVRLGIATDEQAAAGLAEAAGIGMDLDEEFEDTDELTFLVGECGLGFQMPEKVSGDLEDGYEELLIDAAACSGGSVVVEDVELVTDEDGDEYLHFRRNGRSIWHPTEHLSDSTRYMDWNAAFDAIGDLVPGNDDPRGFYQLDEESYDAWWLLLTPDQAEGLKEFGLPVPVQLGNWVRDGMPAAEPETLAWYVEDDRLHASEESRRCLDEWLASMDAALERWRTAHLPDGFPLDHSLDSLSELERLVLDRFDGPDSLEAAAADGFFEGAVRYVGETALRLWPCRWTYQHSDDDSSVFTNEPMIRSNAPNGFAGEFSPDYVLRTLVRSRTSDDMRERMEWVGEAVDSYRKALRARTHARSPRPHSKV
ncbi:MULTISPECIES: hypothetical protein [unclassified Streptomyces]|uniref:hypothetical protein n=1 Tax=unclassified Streptomyces TaxID=2593676 RepID=UPI00236690F9|nr:MULTISPECIES: hypothetical protein [unclassified Streptomyces]MDF3146822.1 hypothetical protein [Streptomyces sp. T21Q-yed]WDF38696.1 hypothetical protein PBV52_18800 [Streptomyces sp. T12]